MHTYVQYVYVFVYIVHTYEAREEEQFLFIFAAHHIANCLQLSRNCAFNTIWMFVVETKKVFLAKTNFS